MTILYPFHDLRAKASLRVAAADMWPILICISLGRNGNWLTVADIFFKVEDSPNHLMILWASVEQIVRAPTAIKKGAHGSRQRWLASYPNRFTSAIGVENRFSSMSAIKKPTKEYPQQPCTKTVLRTHHLTIVSASYQINLLLICFDRDNHDGWGSTMYNSASRPWTHCQLAIVIRRCLTEPLSTITWEVREINHVGWWWYHPQTCKHWWLGFT